MLAGKMVRQQCAACEPGSPTDVKIRNGAGDSEAQAAASSSPGNLYTLHMVMADKHPTHGISGTGIPNKFTLIRPKNAE